MEIAIIGTGYVGLVTGACLAGNGNRVICVDNDPEKLSALNAGKLPIYEPGLDALIKRDFKENLILFTDDLGQAVRESQLIFICVGTPSESNGYADLSAVFEVAEAIARAMNGYKIIITKSTVPVGTTERVQEILARGTTHQFDMLCNPEFLREGTAITDCLEPDRIIIGGSEGPAIETVKELYAPLGLPAERTIVMDIRSAEMTKYATNGFLATKISFMNEMANLCERLGVDVEMVQEGLGADRRIGRAFIFPGVGYGGSCLPKDVKTLIQMGREHSFRLSICEAANQVNEGQPEVFFEKILSEFQGDLFGKKIAVWGLSFKPGTDDMREAPSIKVIELLLEAGARVAVYDPKADLTGRRILGGRVDYVAHRNCAVAGSHALAVITEWDEFRQPDFNQMRELMLRPIIFDGRNIYDPVKLRKMGFAYHGIGKPQETGALAS